MSKLFRCTSNSPFVIGHTSDDPDAERFEPSKVYQEELLCHVSGKTRAQMFEFVGELPTAGMPAKISNVSEFCQAWIDFLAGDVAQELTSLGENLRPLVRELYEVVAKMPDAPVPPVSIDDLRKVRYSSPTDVIVVLKRFRDWAKTP